MSARTSGLLAPTTGFAPAHLSPLPLVVCCVGTFLSNLFLMSVLYAVVRRVCVRVSGGLPYEPTRSRSGRLSAGLLSTLSSIIIIVPRSSLPPYFLSPEGAHFQSLWEVAHLRAGISGGEGGHSAEKPVAMGGLPNLISRSDVGLLSPLTRSSFARPLVC